MSTTTMELSNLSAVSNQNSLSRSELVSIITTVVLAIALGAFAALSAHNHWLLCLAATVGGLGGLTHEFAQSGGKILFFERKLDGIYIGSLAGMVLGAAVGLLAIRGFLIDPKAIADLNITQVSYEVFMAGLGMKGLVEAVGGQSITPAGPSPLKDLNLPAPPSVVPNQ